jgi:hypothetical protein
MLSAVAIRKHLIFAVAIIRVLGLLASLQLQMMNLSKVSKFESQSNFVCSLET